MKKIVAIAALLALVLTLAVPAGAENAGVEKAEFGLGYLNSTAHLLGFIKSRIRPGLPEFHGSPAGFHCQRGRLL